jgi:TonB family protein
MKQLGIALGAMMLTLGGAAVAGSMEGPRPDLPVEGLITEPDWASRPSADDVSRFYPRLPQLIELSGSAAISCAVTVQGALTDCTTVEEKPAGMGFGDAALSLSALFKMKPRTLDGQPVAGGSVRIPINFTMADQATPSVLTTDTASTLSPASLALGRRVAAALQRAFVESGQLQANAALMRQAYGQAGLSSEQEMAIQDYGEALSAAIPARTERMARDYAATIPETLLPQVASFLESPAGRAWLDAANSVQSRETAIGAVVSKMIALDARARLCKQISCLAGKSASAAQGAPAAGAGKP